MHKMHNSLIIKTSSAVFVSFLIASPAFANCPSGYQSINEYDTTEVGLKWSDDPSNTYSRCLNTEAPEKNNVKDSYGIDYGSYPYQCGSIRLDSVYLGNTSILNVKTADPSAPSIMFEKAVSSISYSTPREWCEQEGSQAMCYHESIYRATLIPHYTYIGINKTIYFLQKSRRITECRLISF